METLIAVGIFVAVVWMIIKAIRWFLDLFRPDGETNTYSSGPAAEVVISGPRPWTPPTKPEYRIKYQDKDGKVTDREIAVLYSSYREMPRYIKAWCFLTKAERKFFDDQIIEAVNSETGRKIKSVHQHSTRY